MASGWVQTPHRGMFGGCRECKMSSQSKKVGSGRSPTGSCSSPLAVKATFPDPVKQQWLYQYVSFLVIGSA